MMPVDAETQPKRKRLRLIRSYQAPVIGAEMIRYGMVYSKLSNTEQEINYELLQFG